MMLMHLANGKCVAVSIGGMQDEASCSSSRIMSDAGMGVIRQ